MANRVWRGDAVAVAQVVTVTPGSVVAGRSYALRINGKDISASGSTAAALIAAFADAINNSAIPEWSEVTASAGDVLTLTSRSEGVPFLVEALVNGFTQGAAVVVTVAHSPTGGTWHFNGGVYGEADIAYNASQSDVQTAMDGLYGSGNTLVTKRSYTGYVTYSIEFIGGLGGQSVPSVSVSYANLTGGDAALVVSTVQAAVAGTSEVQRIRLYGSPTGGTWRYTFRGAFVDLAHNVSTSDMQTAIRALSTINGANVDVTGTAGSEYITTFKGALAHQNLEPAVVDASGLTGGSIYASVSVTTPGVTGVNTVQYLVQNTSQVDEVFSITRSGTVSGGTFKLTYDSGGNLVKTDPIAYNAKLYEIISALEALAASKEGTLYAGPYFAPALAYKSNYTMADAGGTLEIACVARAGGQDQWGSGSYNLREIGIETSLTGGGSYSCPGSYSIDGYPTGVAAPKAGPFVLQMASEVTAELTLAVNSNGVVTSPTSAQVQTALEGLTAVGAGNVRVTSLQLGPGNYLGADNYGTRGLWKVEYINAKAGVAMPVLTGYYTGVLGTPFTVGTYQLQGGVAGTTEVQAVTVHGSPTAGDLTLGFKGVSTAAIAYNESALGVEAKLVALSNVDTGDIVASGGALASAPVTLTFGGQYTFTDVPTITVNDNGLKVQVETTTPGVTGKNEIQRLSLVDQDVWGGTVTLSFDGDTASPVSYAATYADVVAALAAATGDADFKGTLGPWPDEPIDIEFFNGRSETNVPAITATDTLKNGTATAVNYDPLIVRTTVPATGPNHWNEPVNWFNPDDPSELRCPERHDSVYLATGRIDILYGLIQRTVCTVDTVNDWIVPAVRNHDLRNGQIVELWTSGAAPSGLATGTAYYIRDLDNVTGKFRVSTTATGLAVNITTSGSGTHQIGVRLDRLLQLATYTGRVGLPVSSSGGYFEYRELDLTIGMNASGTDTITIGQGDGNGTSRFNVDTGTDQVIVEVLNSAGSAETGRPSINWIGENSASKLRVFGGDLGVALRPTETAEFDTLDQRGGEVTLGTVSLVSIDKTGGTLSGVTAGTLSGVLMIRG